MNKWFDVSKEGLRDINEGRPKVFAVYELVQNAVDEPCTTVTVELTPIADRRGKCRLVVTDDSPQGFVDLTEAYTMFAPSKKKGQPELRGRFNLGEKMFLSLCDEAKIVSTTGSIVFEANGERRRGRERTTAGTRIEASLPLTRAELDEVALEVRRLIPPVGKRIIFNGEEIAFRQPRLRFDASLLTMIADEFGVLRRSRTPRDTTVELYDVAEGEVAFLYELGIPVVETGDRWHANILQKVLLNQERDNVTPRYLQSVRTAVLNATYNLVQTEEQAAQPWVRAALSDDNVEPVAVRQVVTAAFGEKAVAYDPSDPEAASTAMSEGYRVIHGGTFSGEQWHNIRSAEVLSPAGRMFPTPRPYSDDPDAPKAHVVDPTAYTPGMRDVVALTKELCRRFLGHGCQVVIVDTPNSFSACYVGHTVDNFTQFHFNVAQQPGREAWFNLQTNLGQIIAEIGHEFAHDHESNHLSANFYRSLERFSGFIAEQARTEPTLFQPGLAVRATAASG